MDKASEMALLVPDWLELIQIGQNWNCFSRVKQFEKSLQKVDCDGASFFHIMIEIIDFNQ